MFCFVLFSYLNRVVSYACYPSFWKKQLEPSGENHCYVSSEHGKNYTNGPCPNALERSNRLYRCASHYRVSSKVSSCCSPIISSIFLKDLKIIWHVEICSLYLKTKGMNFPLYCPYVFRRIWILYCFSVLCHLFKGAALWSCRN